MYTILVPMKNSGGVESYSKALNIFFSKKSITSEMIYLSDYDAGKTIFHFVLKIPVILKILRKNRKIIAHGQFGIISFFKRNTTVIIHGNPLNYYIAASNLRRKLKFKSILLLVFEYISVVIGIIFSKKIIFVSNHVYESFRFILIFKQKSSVFINITGLVKDTEYEIKTTEDGVIAVISDSPYEKGLDRIEKFLDSYGLECKLIGFSNTNRPFKSNLLVNIGKIDSEEVSFALKTSKVLIHFSRYEGLPLCVLEALQQGCVCILIRSKWSKIFEGLESVLIIEESELNYSKLTQSKLDQLNHMSSDDVKKEFGNFVKNKLNGFENVF